MNLNSTYQTSTIVADRRRAFTLDAAISRTRKVGRLARRAARSAVQTAAPTINSTGTTTVTTHIAPRPLVLQPAAFDGPVNGTNILASSDLGHASARVA